MSGTDIVLHVDGFALSREANDTEFRVRDIELAERLGYDQPRDIRKLISRMVESGELTGVLKRATVARMKNKHGVREVPVDEYWLDEIEAPICLGDVRAFSAARVCRFDWMVMS